MFTASVSKIIDGDTIEIKELGERKTIRLWGIDTPEWDQPYSKEAKKYLGKALLNEKIHIKPLYYDKFGRLIAVIHHKKVNINQLLVERGFAWVHSSYCNKRICKFWKKLEKKAQKEKRGLWSQPQPVEPWKWKHR